MKNFEQPEGSLGFDLMPEIDKATFMDVVEFFRDDLPGKYLNFLEYNARTKYWFLINRVSVIEGRVLIDTDGPDGVPLVHEFDGQSIFIPSNYKSGDLWFHDKAWNKNTNNGEDSEVWWGISDESINQMHIPVQEYEYQSIPSYSFLAIFH